MVDAFLTEIVPVLGEEFVRFRGGVRGRWLENKLRLSFATCSELAKKHKHGEHSFEVFWGIEVAAILLCVVCACPDVGRGWGIQNYFLAFWS